MTDESAGAARAPDPDEPGESTQVSPVEEEIARALAAGDVGRAATRIVESYGGEIYAFLLTHLRSPSDASDVYSTFLEHLWSGLPRFEGRCSARGWSYALARNAAYHFVTSPHRRPRRNIALSAEEVARLVERARTETSEYLRTENLDGVRRLRLELQPDERTLLFLRVDRGLSWREIAVILGDPDVASTDASLTRESARVRKQFERVKQRLVTLAREHGLLA
jgi:RNA polymerase sigma-70 factor (ECF subfamily)